MALKSLVGEGFRQWVVTLLFIAGNKVVAVLGYHSVKFGNLVWRILKVGIHGDDDVALCFTESAKECRTFAVVAAKLYAFGVFRLCAEVADDFPGVIGGTVVDENHFVGEAVGFHHAFYPGEEFGERFVFVVKGYYD